MTENLKGELDFDTQRREHFSFNSVLVETGTISSNATELFEISEEEGVVDGVTFSPSEIELPRFGRLMAVRVNIESGSTNTTLSIYEDSSGKDIHQAAQITNLDINDAPESFTLLDGAGLPFVNQQDENAVHLEIDELSGNDSEYEVKLIWGNVNTKAISLASL